jgi:hypothetical protein
MRGARGAWLSRVRVDAALNARPPRRARTPRHPPDVSGFGLAGPAAALARAKPSAAKLELARSRRLPGRAGPPRPRRAPSVHRAERGRPAIGAGAARDSRARAVRPLQTSFSRRLLAQCPRRRT